MLQLLKTLWASIGARMHQAIHSSSEEDEFYAAESDFAVDSADDSSSLSDDTARQTSISSRSSLTSQTTLLQAAKQQVRDVNAGNFRLAKQLAELRKQYKDLEQEYQTAITPSSSSNGTSQSVPELKGQLKQQSTLAAKYKAEVTNTNRGMERNKGILVELQRRLAAAEMANRDKDQKIRELESRIRLGVQPLLLGNCKQQQYQVNGKRFGEAINPTIQSRGDAKGEVVIPRGPKQSKAAQGLTGKDWW